MADLRGLTLVVSGVEQGLGRRSALAAAEGGGNVLLGACTEAILASLATDVDGAGGDDA